MPQKYSIITFKQTDLDEDLRIMEVNISVTCRTDTFSHPCWIQIAMIRHSSLHFQGCFPLPDPYNLYHETFILFQEAFDFLIFSLFCLTTYLPSTRSPIYHFIHTAPTGQHCLSPAIAPILRRKFWFLPSSESLLLSFQFSFSLFVLVLDWPNIHHCFDWTLLSFILLQREWLAWSLTLAMLLIYLSHSTSQ